MAINDFSEQFAEFTSSHLSGIELFAEQTEEAQWASACSVVHTEEERSAVMEAATKVKYTFSREGSSFRLSREVIDETVIMDLITQGKDTPYTKGKGNPVEQLDGSTEPSNSITQGVALPWLAWDAVPIEEDSHTILQDIIPQMINDAATQAIPEFGENVIKPFVSGKLSQLTGGES